jgi:hypothetical protein
MKKVQMFFVTVGVAVLVLPLTALADGVIFPPSDYWMRETDQKAVIFYDKNVETMVISIVFRGNAENFSWIVPTPSRPEVEKSTDELFTALEKLTLPQYDYRMMPPYSGVAEEGAMGGGVNVVETKKVEYYDIAVLEADDPEALTKWLKENKYQFPEEGKYLLDDYINNKWYFTAVKIDTKSLSPGAETQLREGRAAPLKFTFTSSKIVYPLKISGLAEYFKTPEPTSWPEPMPLMESGAGVSGEAVVYPSGCASHDECGGLFCAQVVGQDTPCCIGGQCVCGPSDCRETGVSMPEIYPRPWPIWRPSVGILLYVFSDHKQDLPGFNTDWANWVKSKDIEKLAIESNGESWIKPDARKYYLTKLSRYMQPSEMTYDLYPRDASDNKSVGAPKWEWPNALVAVLIFLVMLSIFMVIGLISPGGIVFILCAILQFFTKSKGIHVLAWIFQGLVFLITFGLGILWLVAREQFSNSWFSLTPYSWQVSYAKSIFAAGLTAWILFLLGMAGIMIWQIFYQLKQIKKK